MYDRAMQALYAFALGPVAEATADIASFGFRKYRSAQDACEQAFNSLCRRNSAQWILEGDIKGCFDNINHLLTRSYITNCLSATPFIRSNPTVECVNGNVGVLSPQDNVESPKVQFEQTARISKL